MSPTNAKSLYLLGCSFSLLVLALVLPAGATQSAKQTEGQKLFLSRCAKCHGANGQGGSQDPDALAGTLTAGELAKFIEKSMPPGPVKCPSPDAQKIAAYIHDAFYSPIAQEKIRPPRVKLVRLTVRQFKNAVSDIVSGFHSAIPANEAHGLRADYYKGRSRDIKNRVIERIDPEVKFDFGTGAPAPNLFEPHNFSIMWQGSVLAPDTGEYDFSIHSKFSVQLLFNYMPKPLVDGEVRSAGDPDPRGTVTLLGGRTYPIVLIFTKATQGVDDSNKKKDVPSAPSFVSLMWKRPKHAEEPIPTQYLFTDSAPQLFTVSTPFPPDDRSTGYERGDSVSKEWDDATTAAAIEAADFVVKQLADVKDDGQKRIDRMKGYCVDFLQLAFRRPIADDVRQTYIEKQFAAAATPEAAVKRVVVLALKSPRFLYRELGDRNDPFTIASELSFGLWDTIPDPDLLKAAVSHGLDTREQVLAQAERMANDRRAWSKLRDFLLLWLKVDEVPDIVKNPKHYPDFNASTASDLRTSFELFLESTAWSKTSDYRDLMLSDTQFLNGSLAKVYGVNLPPDAPFQAVPLDPDQRSGVITHPYLLSRFAYLDGSSPIHRGVLIERNLLGRTLKPPPANFVPLAAAAHPELTTRQRVSLQTKPLFCNNCHGIINPLGYTLERFDAIGRLRETDNGKPVDASGAYRSRNGSLVVFKGAQDLGKYLATSDDAHDAFVERLFVHVAKQPPTAFGPRNLANLQQAFAKNQYSIRKLLVEMVMAIAMPDDKSSAAKGTQKK